MTRVTVEIHHQIAIITMDDGKANVQQDAFFNQLDVALDRAEQPDVQAVVLTGRTGFFSGGLDLKTLPTLSNEGLKHTVARFAEVVARLYAFPKPVVAAVTGHAIAGGAVLLLTADHRVGPAGAAIKIGLNEVAIGIALPEFVLQITDQVLSQRHKYAATVFGRVYGPDDAVDVGFLQETVPPSEVLSAAKQRAQALGSLPAAAFQLTKARTRGTLDTSAGSAFEEELGAFLQVAGAP